MMSYHPCERKTIRWYKKIFIHVIMMIMMNSHLLFNMYNKKKMNLYDFRLEVIKSLLPPPLVESPAQKRKRNEAHKLVKIAERDHNNRTKRKKCRQCTNDGKHNVKTTFQCESCPDKPEFFMNKELFFPFANIRLQRWTPPTSSYHPTMKSWFQYSRLDK
ncbi:hypothetical protein J6590_008757 [Homalodisca vitripennis]|nr:hypothetical protein J6590_008757 [Homalodisca vitripennis]